MRKEDNSTNSGTNFSDVWTSAQISRSTFLGALFRKAWLRMFGSAAGDNDQPVSSARQYLGA